MNEWSKEQLEEMFGDNVIEQLAFLSGCTKHSYCDPSHTALNGYIVSHEKLEKFAELIVQKCMAQIREVEEQWLRSRLSTDNFTEKMRLVYGEMTCNRSINKIENLFGVKE